MKNYRCKKCNNNLIHLEDKKVKIRTNIIIFEKSFLEDNFSNAKSIIKCPKCKGDNEIPLTLNFIPDKINLVVFEKDNDKK